MELQEFLERFDGVAKSGGQYVARCPVHDDRKQSVSIGSDEDKIKLCCHAGCPTETILDCLSLKFSDLFFKPLNGNGAVTNSSEIIAEYPYRDEDGNLLYQVVRYEPKDFRQRRPDGMGGWIWNLNGTRRVPYMLPDLVSNPDEQVFIVEGEKDVHSLRAHGYIATTNAGGAGMKWSSDWNDFFKDRVVYLVPDRDRPGYERVNKIGATLLGSCHLRLVELFGYRDITEWLEKNPASDLTRLTESASEWVRPVSFTDFNTFPDVDTSHGLMGSIVSALLPHTEADPIALYVELMTLVGSHIGPAPYYWISGTKHHTNLYLVVCGETAKGRKGSAHDMVLDFFRRVDQEFTANNIMGGMSTGEGVIHVVRNSQNRMDKNGKEVEYDPGIKDKRRLFFESELAGRTLPALHKENSSLSAVLRQAWDSSPLNIATKQNSERATDTHISILGHATPHELLNELKPQDVTGGLANRFIFFHVQRSKLLPRPTDPDEETLKSLAAKLRIVLSDAKKTTRVLLSPAAQTAWEKIYLEMYAHESTLGDYEAMLSRGPAHIMRMALIHCLVDSRTTIEPHDLDIACQLWAYSAKTIEYLINTQSLIPPDPQRLLDLLEDQDRNMSAEEIKRALNWNGRRVAQARAWLLGQRLIHQYSMSSGGRPRQMIGMG